MLTMGDFTWCPPLPQEPVRPTAAAVNSRGVASTAGAAITTGAGLRYHLRHAATL